MQDNEQWHLDDEGRLHRAMMAHDKAKSEWTRTPVAQTRGEKAADRVINGIQFLIYSGVAVMMGGFALVSLGYIEAPSKTNQPAVIAPTLPDTGTDSCGK